MINKYYIIHMFWIVAICIIAYLASFYYGLTREWSFVQMQANDVKSLVYVIKNIGIIIEADNGKDILPFLDNFKSSNEENLSIEEYSILI